MQTEEIAVAELHQDPANARAHNARNLEAIKASLVRFGQQKPIVVSESGIVVAGNGTLEAARALGWETIACVRTELAGSDATAYAIADNRTAELAEWDDDALAATLEALQNDPDYDHLVAGFTDDEIAELVGDLNGVGAGAGLREPGPSLAEQFGAVPFSVLNTREGWWQERKRRWQAMGIDSGKGRAGFEGAEPAQGVGES